jgi:predicted ATP-grasp superfamily ATP-dependent carboligase
MNMQPTVLITLGRLPKALDLARGFRAIGWRVIVAEPFRWHLTRMSRDVARSVQVSAPATDQTAYLDDLVALIRSENISLVVPVSEEIMHTSFLHTRLRELPDVALFCPPPETLLPLHDKWRFTEVCAALGMAAPATARGDVPDAVAVVVRSPYVVKPRLSCSGNGVSFHAADEPFAAPEGSIAQAKIDGPVMSSFALAHDGEVACLVLYRAAILSGTVAVAFERVPQSDPSFAPACEWVQAFIARTRYTGFISFDLIMDTSGKVYGIECNPRATSGLHFVEAADLARAIVAIARKQTVPSVGARALGTLMQFYPTLTEVQKGMFKRGFFARLTRFLRAKDVSFQWRDPWPFWTMTFTAWNIIWMSIKRGVTFGEVATLDIGWYADLAGEIDPSAPTGEKSDAKV